MAEAGARKYRAFISYSHADTSSAKWLHRGLERFRIDKDLVGRETPTGIVPTSLRPVFRDRDDFTAGHSLTDQTLAALDASAALIVICSPHAAKSQYVAEEIRLYRSRHPGRPVIPLIVDGKPGDPEQECFPPPLRFELDADGAVTDDRREVLAADFREEGDGKNLALAKVVAGLLGVSPDDVFRRAERERRRQGRVRKAVGGTIAALVLVGVVFGWQAQQSRQELSEIEALVAQYSFVGSAEAAVPGARRSLTDAITSIAQGAGHDPRYAKALELLKEGKPEEAEPLLAAVAEDKKKAAEVQNKEAAEAFRNLASIASISEPQKARTYYAEAAALDPSNVEGMYHHGWYQLQAGSLDGAEDAFRHVLRDDRESSWAVWSRIGLGDIYEVRGDLAAALGEYRAAGEIAEHVTDPDPEANPEAKRNLAYVYGRIGGVLMLQRQFDEALPYYTDKIEIAYALVQADPESGLAQSDLAAAAIELGDVLAAQNKQKEALTSYQAGLAILDALAKANPGNASLQQMFAFACLSVGDVLAAQGNLTDALTTFQAGVTVLEHLAGADPGNAELLHTLSVARQAVGYVLMRQGNSTDALIMFKQGLAVIRELTETDPDNAVWQHSLFESFNNVGEALSVEGNLDEALEYFQEGLTVSDRLAKAHPDHADAQAAMARSHGNIGLLLLRRGDTAGARASLQQARQVVVQLKGRGNDATPIYTLYEAVLIALVEAAASMQENDEAGARNGLQQARDALATIKERHPNDYVLLARLDDAIARLQETVGGEGRATGAD